MDLHHVSEPLKQAGHTVLVHRPDDGTWVMILMIIAAVSGAIGGTAGAAHIFLARDKTVRLMQVVAYIFLGMAMGIMSLVLLKMFNHYMGGMNMSLEEMVGFSMAFGFGGSLVLSGTNILVAWTTKKFGRWEIQFTARKNTDNRRRSTTHRKTKKTTRKKKGVK